MPRYRRRVGRFDFYAIGVPSHGTYLEPKSSPPIVVLGKSYKYYPESPDAFTTKGMLAGQTRVEHPIVKNISINGIPSTSIQPDLKKPIVLEKFPMNKCRTLDALKALDSRLSALETALTEANAKLGEEAITSITIETD